MRYVIGTVAILLVACGGNRYGYAPEYAPYGDEDDYYEQARDLPYEDVRRNPAEVQNVLIGWFGLVREVTPVQGTAGRVRVRMDLRFHQPRHLCSGEFDDSCRVTISQKSGGPFTVIMDLAPEDRAGRDRVWAGSLLKVYGHALTEFDEDGGPVLQAKHYRHWPSGTYVTTGGAATMRR